MSAASLNTNSQTLIGVRHGLCDVSQWFRFPQAPSNIVEYEKGKGSNEKPKPKLKKDEKMIDVERDAVFEENEKLKAEVEGFKNELEIYREKMLTRTF